MADAISAVEGLLCKTKATAGELHLAPLADVTAFSLNIILLPGGGGSAGRAVSTGRHTAFPRPRVFSCKFAPEQRLPARFTRETRISRC